MLGLERLFTLFASHPVFVVIYAASRTTGDKSFSETTTSVPDDVVRASFLCWRRTNGAAQWEDFWLTRLHSAEWMSSSMLTETQQIAVNHLQRHESTFKLDQPGFMRFLCIGLQHVHQASVRAEIEFEMQSQTVGSSPTNQSNRRFLRFHWKWISMLLIMTCALWPTRRWRFNYLFWFLFRPSLD